MSTLHVAELAGGPRERGRQHGESLREAVRERDRRWRAAIASGTGLPPERFIERFLAGTDFLPAIEHWTPGLLDEVRGIAEAAGLPYAAVLAAQLMDEEWWFAQALRSQHHCSSLGRVADGRALLAQTMDLPGWMDGAQAVLRIRGSGGEPDAIVLTVAGMVGLCGVNAAGLGVCVNTLAQLPAARDGLPVAFVSRGLLAHRRLDAALGFLRTVRHASGQNYLVGTSDGLADLECCADGAYEVRPATAPPGALWHTNHPLADQPASGSSRHRMAALERRLAGAERPWDAAFARSVLSDRSDRGHPVSRRREAGTGFFTFAAVVWDLSAGPVAQVAPGPPCSTEFSSFGFPPG